MKENPVGNKLEFGIKLLGACRADTVTELCLRIIPNINVFSFTVEF